MPKYNSKRVLETKTVVYTIQCAHRLWVPSLVMLLSGIVAFHFGRFRVYDSSFQSHRTVCDAWNTTRLLHMTRLLSFSEPCMANRNYIPNCLDIRIHTIRITGSPFQQQPSTIALVENEQGRRRRRPRFSLIFSKLWSNGLEGKGCFFTIDLIRRNHSPAGALRWPCRDCR